MKKHSKPSFKFSKKDKFYKPKEKVCTHCVCVFLGACVFALGGFYASDQALS